MSAARKLIDDLLALPEADRAEIALELVASLDGATEDEWEASWTAELDRRAASAAPTEAWSDVRERLFSSSIRNFVPGLGYAASEVRSVSSIQSGTNF